MGSIIFPVILSLMSHSQVVLALLTPYLVLQSQLKLLFLDLIEIYIKQLLVKHMMRILLAARNIF